jgi:pilus assembly protein Flp/PilA
MESIKRFLSEEEGATAVEYGIMVAAIAGVIIAIVVSLGDTLNTKFGDVNTAVGTLPVNQ